MASVTALPTGTPVGTPLRALPPNLTIGETAESPTRACQATPTPTLTFAVNANASS